MSTEKKQAKPEKEKKAPKVYKVWYLPCERHAKPQELSVTKKEVNLQWLQMKVGGYITTRQTYDENMCMVCNDEALLIHLPSNHHAFQWLPKHERDANNYGFPICGDVLIVPNALM